MRILIIDLALWTALSGAVMAHDLPVCRDPETAALREVSGEELQSHGGRELGPVEYPAGTTHRNFRFYVGYVVDIAGHVSCIVTAESGPPARKAEAAEMTPERQALLDTLAATTFTPFVTGGQAEKVRVENQVYEEERPAYHILPPQGDRAKAVIELQLNGHRSTEGAYTLLIKGDGRVTLKPNPGGGSGLNVWLGQQTYRIPPERVTAMLDLAEKADFWSLRDDYMPASEPKYPYLYSGPDAYFQRITITLGGRSKTLVVHDWGNPGVPLTARELMRQMAALAGIELWQNLKPETIAILKQNGFDFRSQKGCDLLIKSTAYTAMPDSAIQRILNDGASPKCLSSGVGLLDVKSSLLDAAIITRRTALAERLIAQGALLRNGQPDTTKATRALVHAVAIGNPDMFDRIMTYHPELMFRHTTRQRPPRPVTDPVITVVGAEDPDFHAPWDPPYDGTDRLIAVTQKLLDAGVDLNSRDWSGANVLTHAVENSHIGFVRWLLNKGLSPKRADGSWPYFLGDEDMAVLMLDAGAGDDPDILREVSFDAQHNHMPRVEAWLRAHGKWQQD